ncbi:unnamed protein product [Heligmosomoides polygyrus]|uniref:Malate dehydrogenase, cytoplasmic n=1 Tax=Heligmosomoides polygyrus TaxID=6339 RepID=A0A183G8R0_HELPZ|nr:unnamed protein product [Heligmosomoides polygyrus]
MPRKQGMERRDLLAANVKIFKSQGLALAKYAKPTVKVLVVGNPTNTNCYICYKFAASAIPETNFSALSRLDHNRTVAQLAMKAGVRPSDVKNVIVWGNHSNNQFPDVSHATIRKGHRTIDAYTVVNDIKYLRGPFISGEWVSMAVPSDGAYGISLGLVFSFPVTVDPNTKEYSVVWHLPVDDFARVKLGANRYELEQERLDALRIVGASDT